MTPTIVKTVDVEMQDLNNRSETKLELYKMNPFPRKMLLNRFSTQELLRLASISTSYFNWVRGYFSEYKVINLKPHANKMCLSREPCSISNFSCHHRVLRSVSSVSDFFKIGLLQIETVCIQAPFKPRNLRCSTNFTKKVCSFFTRGIRKVVIDVSVEKPYVGIVEKLLKKNDNTLQQFMVRNSNVDESKLNFPHFLNRTIWTTTNFPMRSGYAKRKVVLKTKKKQAQLLAQQQLDQVNQQNNDPNVQ